MLQDAQKRAVFRACLCLYLTLGFMALTTSAALKSIITQFSWTDAQGGLFISLQSMGNLLASLLGGVFIRLLGKKRTLYLFPILASIGFGGMVVTPLSWPMFPLAFITGIAWGINNTLVNLVIADAYGGSARRINIVHAMYAVGAVLAPLAVTLFLNTSIGWRGALLGVTILSLLSALVIRRMPMAGDPISGTDVASSPRIPILKMGRFYAGFFLFFIYVGVEAAIGAWLATFLYDQNAFFQRIHPETMLSLMWLLIIAGRVLSSALGGRIPPGRMLLMQAAGFFIGVLGLVLFARHTWAAILSVMFTGLSMSAMYGTAVAYHHRLFTLSPTVPGLMFAGGGLGSSLIPLLAGSISDAAGITRGMGSLTFFLAALVLLIAGLNIVDRAQERQSPTN